MVLLPCVKVHTKHDFTLEDQCATRGCSITPPLFHGEALCHRPSVASVHLKVLTFAKMLLSCWSRSVRPSCDLTCTLSVRQRSAENTEKKKKISAAEKKASVRVGSREEVNWSFLAPPPHHRAFPGMNWSKSMSFYVKTIPDQAGTHPVLRFSPTVLALKRPEPHTYSRYGGVSERVNSSIKMSATSLRRRRIIWHPPLLSAGSCAGRETCSKAWRGNRRSSPGLHLRPGVSTAEDRGSRKSRQSDRQKEKEKT